MKMVIWYSILLLFLYQEVLSVIFADVITYILKEYGNSEMVTLFSCNKEETTMLFKNLLKNSYYLRTMSTRFDSFEYIRVTNHHIFIINIKCENIEDFFVKVNNLGLFASPYKWIIYDGSNNTSIQDNMENSDILLNSDVTVCRVQGNDSVLVEKWFKRYIRDSIQTEVHGFWTQEQGFVASSLDRNLNRRRRDLHGITLKTSIVITNKDSLKHLTDKRDKHIDSIAKVNYVLVEHLSNIVNVSLNYSVQSTWGYKNEEGKWSGMIGELTRNEADIGGTPLFFTIDRVDIIDYIAMTTPTRSKFVFREPKLSYVTNVFTLPFDKRVWISTICMVTLIGIFLYVILKWEWIRKSYESQRGNTRSPELKDSLTEVIFFSFGAVCQQGAPAIPYSIPGRITTIILFISLMFLYTSYSANIVALLQSSSTSIQTLEDLLKSRLQVGVDDTVFNRFYFPNASEAVRRAIYLQKVAPPGKKEKFMSIEEGVKWMRQGLFAFHMETGPGYKLVGEIFQESEKCGLKEIQYLQVIDPWLAIQKNSSFKKFLKIGLRKIQESGLQSREVGLIYTKRPICTSRGSSFISVGIVDCYPAAVVLATGLIISVGIFACEVIIQYYRECIASLVRKEKHET